MKIVFYWIIFHQHNFERSANNLYINITIPNVDCSDGCALQALSVMTDKIEPGSCCIYESDGISGSCFSNYHSCANVYINGQQNRNKLQCLQPSNWPYKDWTKDIYTQESSSIYWNEKSLLPLDLELITDGGGIFPPNPCQQIDNVTFIKAN